jgi:NTP pyrophosphatase (non-canonical NTP hydrolase)
MTELTPAETELLTILAEEAAEVVQATTKILRFGPTGETYPDGTTKLNKLIEEWADMRATIELIMACPNLSEPFAFAQWNRLMAKKSERIAHWTRNDWVKQMATENANVFRAAHNRGADR